MKQKVVVTGGAGFIGSHLARALAGDGYEVAVVDLKQGSDILKPEDLQSAMKDAVYVFHLAALPSVQFSIEQPRVSNKTNVEGTIAVLATAQEMGVKRVIFSASSAAYGDQTVRPLSEDLPAQPKSPYALQKYIGELYCKLFTAMHGVETVSLRYFNVYGPGADPGGAYAAVVPKFINMVHSGTPMTVTGDGKQTRDYVHVRDVVRANTFAATSDRVGRGEVINVGTGVGTSVNELAKIIGGPVEYIEAWLEPRDSIADNSRAKELLGWSPTVSLQEGIAELKRQAGLE